ncbi:hypothetical protein DPMN_047318 [Dreissena polymorpha]|uniref:Uncharacterized protein n=1 Tax=Dreissena polymorpha TaxID=45954 RepID=A0A9D4D8H7_DREPO|nr:hypothetical protein DPMN_047318 [Dreissena polymorpha]
MIKETFDEVKDKFLSSVVKRLKIIECNIFDQTKEIESLHCQITSKDKELQDLKTKLNDSEKHIAHKKIRPVIVRFIRRQTKSDVKRNAKLLKGSGIFLNKDLTKLNAEILASVRLKDPETVE